MKYSRFRKSIIALTAAGSLLFSSAAPISAVEAAAADLYGEESIFFDELPAAELAAENEAVPAAQYEAVPAAEYEAEFGAENAVELAAENAAELAAENAADNAAENAVDNAIEQDASAWPVDGGNESRPSSQDITDTWSTTESWDTPEAWSTSESWSNSEENDLVDGFFIAEDPSTEDPSAENTLADGFLAEAFEASDTENLPDNHASSAAGEEQSVLTELGESDSLKGLETDAFQSLISEESLLEIDPDEPEVHFEEIEEEELLEAGYDPTVTPGPTGTGSGALRMRSLRALGSSSASGARFIDNYTSFYDQLETFSQYIYGKMEEVYINADAMGTSQADDTDGSTVPALRIEIPYTDAIAYGLTFPAQIYTGTDGKKHIDTGTDDYKTAYHNITFLIQSCIDAFTYDHPELYWYRPNGYKTGYSAIGEASGAVYTGYFSSVTLLMKEPFAGAYDLREEFRSRVQSVSGELAGSADFDGDGMVSTLEYIQASQDYIVRRAYYDRAALNSYTSTGDYRIFTAAGLFVDSVGGGVVCEGYSKAMKVLLDAQEIGCCLIPGVIDARSEGHMWNGVCLNGSWYLLDATWDDKGDTPDSSSYYSYYLVSEIAGRTTSGRISDRTKADAQEFAYPAVISLPAHSYERVTCEPYRKYACTDGDGIAYWLPMDASKTARVEPTCEEAGNIEYYTCNICGKLFSDSTGTQEITLEQTVLSATGHNLVRTPEKVPTCEEAGNIEYYTCTACGKIYRNAAAGEELSGEAVILPATGHTKGSMVDRQEPDCASMRDGNIAHCICGACGACYLEDAPYAHLTPEEVVLPAEHNCVYTQAVEPTCEEAGNIGYYTCEACGKYFLDSEGQQEISAEERIRPAAGHAMKQTAAKAPTCLEDGNILYYTCSTCGRHFLDSAGKNEISQADTMQPATGHQLVHTKAAAATCEKPGNTEYYTCTACGRLFSDSEGSAGAEITSEQIVLAAVGHNLVKTAKKAPTCEKAGSITYYTCSTCGKLFSDSKGKKSITKQETILPATGHSWDTGTITTWPTVSKKGVRTYTCLHDASHKKTESIPKLTKKQAEGDPAKKLTVAWAEKRITTSSGQLPGASAATLRMKTTGQTGKTITLAWNRIKEADGYILYMAPCGSEGSFRRIAKITSGSTTTHKVKKLKKGTFYKFSLCAYKTVNGIEQVIASAKLIHVVTKGGKLTNIAKVKTSKKAVTLKESRTTKIKAVTILQAKNKKTSIHRGLRYETSNKAVATVNAKTGKVKAKGPGTCVIYIYAQTGVCAKVKITVK